MLVTHDDNMAQYAESLSSRRAWIEIRGVPETFPRQTVVSPHGERGLKLSDRNDMYLMKVVALSRSVD